MQYRLAAVDTQEKILRAQIGQINAARRMADPLAPLLNADLAVQRMRNKVLKHYGLRTKYLPPDLQAMKAFITKGGSSVRTR